MPPEMMNRFTLLLFLSSLFIIVQSHEVKASDFAMADSMRVRWIDGKKFILHKVEPKQTWNFLAKKYNCSIKDLKAANNGVNDLKIGQIINIPVITASETSSGAGTKVTEKNSDTNNSPQVFEKSSISHISNKAPVYHIVKQGETLYGISRIYDQTVDEIKLLNNLVSNDVKEGQKLLVVDNNQKSPISNTSLKTTEISSPKTNIKTNDLPEKVNAAVPKVVKNDDVVVPASTATNNFAKATKTVSPIKKANGGKTLMQVNETGVASWIQNGQLNDDKYYGLHRTAPIGTIIKVTNRMNNQFVYVKIVGVLPDTGDNDNVIIKVSQAVTTKLNALDSIFQVDLSYGIMQ